MFFRLQETDLEFTTRSKGEPMRRKLIEEVERLGDSDVLFVSFAGVDAVTPSFADECFGKLLVDLGRDRFQRRIRLVDANETVKAVVNAAINNRAKAVATLTGSSDAPPSRALGKRRRRSD